MSKPLQGKRALATGASRGIGAGIVRRLASDGSDVAFTYASSPDKANAVAAEVRAIGGKAVAIQADSADDAAVVSAVEQTVTQLGGIDILVNNAGIAVIKPVAEISLAEFDKLLAINVRAVFVASQAAAKHMTAGGRIIDIGSTNADRMPFAGGSIYSMSKAALVGLVKGLARDLGSRGNTVNNIQPGPVDTDLNPADGAHAQGLLDLMAIKRYGKSEEIAAMVAYLAGPEAGYITGASLTIDGGFGA